MEIIQYLKKKAGAILIAAVLAASLAPGAAAYNADTLVPVGSTVGINLQSEGVIIVGVPDVLADGASVSPARDAGLAAGDIITRVGTSPISSGDDLRAALGSLDGSPVSVTVKRGERAVKLTVTPHKNAEGECELGLFMRDGVAGIGTVTFIDPKTGVFGALGHSVNDAETGMIIPLRTGSISRSVVTDVILGKAGMPGQLHGTYSFDTVLGALTNNTSGGIFGTMADGEKLGGKKALPVASDAEIKTGPAVILSNVSGADVREYDVEITRLYSGAEAVGRSMMLCVTDPELIEHTGGIVQGMSGSPIIQNGKIIGAVTHVLINDPTRGYGISIEKMLGMIDDAADNKAA